jgi:hypothetical protein
MTVLDWSSKDEGKAFGEYATMAKNICYVFIHIVRAIWNSVFLLPTNQFIKRDRIIQISFSHTWYRLDL